MTSPTGAAVRDVLHVLGRRYAGLELVLAPCRVQGQGAELEIAAAIALLNRWSASDPGHRLDAILVARGGGSLEDLWAFNEEAVARAIHASAVPVISAVGHEIDFTIGDFVADVRAATPSAAAEILTAGYVASREQVAGLAGRLARNLRTGLEDAAEFVDALRARLARAHPRRRLEERAQQLDDLAVALARRAAEALRAARQRTDAAAAQLRRSDGRIGVSGAGAGGGPAGGAGPRGVHPPGAGPTAGAGRPAGVAAEPALPRAHPRARVFDHPRGRHRAGSCARRRRLLREPSC